MSSLNDVQVSSRNDLVALLHQLSDDFKSHPTRWENSSIDDYLDAMAAWIEDMEGYYLNFGKPVPQRIDWSFMADVVIAARDYE